MTGRSGDRMRGLAFGLALAVLSGCSVLTLPGPLRIAEADWATEGGAPTRANHAALVLRPPLAQAWRYNAEGGFGPAAALAANGTVLVATRHGEVHALSAREGKRLGVGEVGEAVEGAPVVTERALYVPVTGGRHSLVAYDFVRGVTLWRVRGGDALGGLLRVGGGLVAAYADGSVRRFALGDGEEVWRVVPDSAAAFAATPVLLPDGAVAVADDRGRVTALDPSDGRTRWAAEVGAPVYATPAAAGGLLFVPTTGGRLVALDASSGAEVWTLAAPSPLARFAAPAVHDGLLVVGASDGRLRAVDAATGAERWSFRTDGNFASAPLLTPDVVYAGALDRLLYALDRETGEVLWQTELEGRIKTTPVIAAGRLVVLAEPRFVYAFEPEAVAAREASSRHE